MKGIIYLLMLLLCGISLAKEVQMHITDETTYLDVGRLCMERNERGEKVLIGNKTVPFFIMYCGIVCPAETTIVLYIKRSNLIGCSCSLPHEQRDKFRKSPEYTYVESSNDVAIIEYVKSMAGRYSFGEVIEIVIYPYNFNSKIIHNLSLFQQLATLFPEIVTYVHIEEAPNFKD